MPQPAPAQVNFTTNVLTSPEFLGLIATGIALGAGKLGVHIFDDPVMQAQLVVGLGVLFTAIGHYYFPGASGKLGLTAPPAWAAPPAQSLYAGTSVVAIPAPADLQRTTAVLPLDVGTHTVAVAAPAPPVALPPTVTVTRVQ